MSTDKQDLSLELQGEAIQQYAAAHSMEVIRSYADPGRSGLSLAGREGMRRLLKDVLEADCPFRTVLVLDVTRWGRFQDVDESAYYEYHCRSNGVSVVYVAEPFKPETTPFDAILKQLKRAMAAEYSRELAKKCQAGQVKAVTMGFACGLPPCIGFKRESVSADGLRRVALKAGERKPNATDRVRWVHSSPHEVALVRRIFDEFVGGMHVTEIVRRLNSEGERTQRGDLFTPTKIQALLRAEVVTGTFRWGTRRVKHSGESIVPALATAASNNMVAAIIPKHIFELAQARTKWASTLRNSGYPAEHMLEKLKAALARNPGLRGDQFREHGLPSATAFRSHFGSLLTAYALAGRPKKWSDEWVERMGHAHAVGKRFARDVYELIATSGQPCTLDQRRHLIHGAGVEVKVRTARVLQSVLGDRWMVPHAHRERAPGRWLLVMRLNRDRCTGRDFILLSPSVHSTFSGKIGPRNEVQLRSHVLGDELALRDALARVFAEASGAR